jgi:hypothetical protein
MPTQGSQFYSLQFPTFLPFPFSPLCFQNPAPQFFFQLFVIFSQLKDVFEYVGCTFVTVFTKPFSDIVKDVYVGLF